MHIRRIELSPLDCKQFRDHLVQHCYVMNEEISLSDRSQVIQPIRSNRDWKLALLMLGGCSLHTVISIQTSSCSYVQVNIFTMESSPWLYLRAENNWLNIIVRLVWSGSRWLEDELVNFWLVPYSLGPWINKTRSLYWNRKCEITEGFYNCALFESTTFS